MTNQNDDLRRTDPGFTERMLHFADVEVAQDPDTALDPQTRYLAILATLLGCQGTDEFRIQLARALDAGLTPVQVKEVVYQAVDYLGIGRVRPFLGITNEVLEARGVGNSADLLRKVVLQCLPYIGYPRTLNALSTVGEAEQAVASAE
ncbi:carboxymuconolactone decarboxylase family protein [Bifidobacterium pseudolongum]|uniref:Carboxymuconolactone decarboxylase n=1 Tax=Bifidobacterium pseudolongum subsp. globosum TaxID=1690 RepID=A0A2N3R6E4_9BIFI|nr:carboxymuconolactone decarboxylase family protein [Bifidobacterium pseudolongum]PKV04915.1 carboxymuconolactone decarboxylase [Bifidobacterium pseudolongum subsp. globosum]